MTCNLYFGIGLVLAAVICVPLILYYIYKVGYLFVTDQSRCTAFSLSEIGVCTRGDTGDHMFNCALSVLLMITIPILWPLVIVGAAIYGVLYMLRAVVRLTSRVARLEQK